MPTSREYQFFAQECVRWADQADDEADRQAFLEMAKVWTQLALHGNEASQYPRRPNRHPQLTAKFITDGSSDVCLNSRICSSGSALALRFRWHPYSAY